MPLTILSYASIGDSSKTFNIQITFYCVIKTSCHSKLVCFLFVDEIKWLNQSC